MTLDTLSLPTQQFSSCNIPHLRQVGHVGYIYHSNVLIQLINGHFAHLVKHFQFLSMKIERLEQEAFKEYGDVLEVTGIGFNANQGTAKRFNYLTTLINYRTKESNNDLNNPEAKLNCCIFRVTPASLPFSIK